MQNLISGFAYDPSFINLFAGLLAYLKVVACIVSNLLALHLDSVIKRYIFDLKKHLGI